MRATDRTGGRAAQRARRSARQERWRRPLTSAGDRRAAWASLLISDHGVLRFAYRNRHRVSDLLWRSSQPSPADVAWAKRAGINTVLSLRGDGFGGDLLEREACSAHGLAFTRLKLYSRAAPSKERLRAAIAMLPELRTPVLMHCKSGADRAGLGAALWLLLVEGGTAADAQRQLSLRFGHIARAKTGILDAFLASYAATGEARGIDFPTWVEEVYDPAALTMAFRTDRTGDALLALLRRE